MRIGIVCPYSLDVAGGVQAHVLDLARALRGLGHHVDVLAPADDDTPVPEHVTRGGRAVGIPYNGSVARLTFGPVSLARVRRWLREGDFDVLHVHEPTAPSLSMLALVAAEGPVVATFHTSTPRSRTMTFFEPVLRPLLERVTARIAVSPLARQVYVEHLGGDAVEIPNGVDVAAFAGAAPLPGHAHHGDGATVGFVGRYTEPRKGMPLLLEALRPLAPRRPDLRLLVVGRGDADELRREAGPVLAERIELLGAVDEATKAAMLASVDLLATPNSGGESFGVVLAEGMAAGAPVVASDIDAFRRVLGDPPAGVTVPAGDAAAWSAAIGALLDDPARREAVRDAGHARVAAFDWSVVAAAVLRVYEVAVAADPRRVVPGDGGEDLGAPGPRSGGLPSSP
ncbi:glycosyltransferase family 4 protein [Actinomycetospora cinnamomea]|uniref:Phosphatidylinositol alpha-mannosyltransferase n=1 Tax=Actinomycetospora cinnamomea TaxID=663609 RepID=A0A2U1EBP6_9PSEU|nr:glycosyltransferase family 4 protein [Actinomycetospora cinnamomea]PVY97305.1 phosphatidylinositol alpha-mannosyltransferase [Actinomycetospora cinnamomea]